MTEPTRIETVVMRRVRRISVLRVIVSGVVLALALALLALWGIGREVWVAKVFSNGPQDFSGRALYLAYAFVHTRFVVQGLVLLALGSFLFLAREVVRAALGGRCVPRAFGV